MPDEPDVRFLLVHHSVSPNDYSEAGAVDLLRGIYGFHTGARGWPDIAYNFFVDRFGRVFEGRTGSLDGAKAADATGGSQGFAQLGCFLGDHRDERPSDAALDAMARLLGWLAERHGLDLSPGATTTFVSRGSNLHPAGATVTAAIVSGHRDMSATACPGDAAYALVADGAFAALARASQAAPGAPPTTTAAAPATTAPTTTGTAAPTTAAPSTTGAPPATGEAAPPATTPARDDGPDLTLPLAGVAGGLLTLAGGLLLRLRRRTGR